MSITYSTTVGNNRLQTVIDAIDGKTFVTGSGTGAAGSLVIGTSALSGATGVLATIPLSLPCGTKSGKVLTIAGVPLSTTASASGTAAKAELRNSSGTVIADGLTVGTSSADVIVVSTTVGSGQTLSVTSAAITHP
jgi:hypothetical protein